MGKRVVITLCCLSVFVSVSAFSDTWVVRDRNLVEDTTLRDGEYAEFNFGAGPFLQVGCLMGSEASAYNAVSLIRFDVSQVPCRKVTGAKLRLYKPKCFVQQRSVRVGVYELVDSNCDWAEGCSESRTDANGASWCFKRGTISWAGRKCGLCAGRDFNPRVLDIQVAERDRGHWVEFVLPNSLVERWLRNPGHNAGVLIRLQESSAHWGDHAFFCSSESYWDRTPELVIQGEQGRAANKSTRLLSKNVKVLPDDVILDRWIGSNRRLARFAKELGLNREQARVFCYIDLVVRCRLLIPLYKMPIARLNPALEAAANRKDEKEARRLLGELRKAMLTYEYIHDTQWYTAGPLAEVLSERQLATLFAVCLFGRQEERARESGLTIWQPVEGAALEQAISATLDRARRKLELTPEQFAAIKNRLVELRRKEEYHLSAFRRDLDRLRELLRNPDSDPQELFALTRSLFFNHEAFLYYQSIYVGPRWQLFLRNAPVTAFARWIVEVRREHYRLDRVERELREAQAFLQ